MINRAFLAGNITADPQLRATPSGTSILSFGLAVNDRRKNQQTGEWQDKPNFFDCKIFGRRAEALSAILTKGMHVSIEGHLDWSSWEDRDTGAKRSKIEVIVDEVELMSPRQGQGQSQMPRQAPQMPQMAPQAPQGYANPPQPQMAPQMAPQPPAASVYGNYQPTQQPPQSQQYYDEEIPF